MSLTKKYRPGQKVIHDKLTADLKIKRTPLRSALQMPEVESIPGQGMTDTEHPEKSIILTQKANNK